MKALIEQTKQFVQSVLKEEYSGHDYYHIERVYHCATNLAFQENANVELVQLAALLHDIEDRKLDTGYTVQGYLEGKVSQDIIVQIQTIIQEVSFKGTDSKVPSTIEGMCVQDADRLDAIGAIGIARAFAYGGNKHQLMYDPTLEALKDMDEQTYYHHKTSTIHHFYEKLLLLKDMMNTESAKQLANQRHEFMEMFLEQFYKEWNGQ